MIPYFRANAPPTAFISYTHDNDIHSSKAVRLADRLRGDGIDASIDAYEPHPIEGWYKWMERQLQKEFLIIILSPRYIIEFNQDLPTHSGARYESAMVSALLFQSGVSFKKIAIVCFNEWSNLDVPLILAGCTRYLADQLNEYKKLYAFLTGQALAGKPPLGKIISLRPASPVVPVPLKRSFSDLCKAIWPLMEDNKRIFEDFGPNSGAAKPGETNRAVRFDLTLWSRQRLEIGENNRAIAEHLRSNIDMIPDTYAAVFRQLLSHIEAFSQHLADEDVDYRDHQFPHEVTNIVKGEL